MIDHTVLPYVIEPMRVSDLDEVVRIENVSFTAPWSRNAFEYELNYNQIAHYVVARPREAQIEMPVEKIERPFWARWLDRDSTSQDNFLVGYAGFWKMVDEAHISTIAVTPEMRRRGIGEMLLIAMIDAAQERSAKLVTLEVRKSNETAQALYRKYGFEIVGERKRYYSDNFEDAWIMTTPEIALASFNARLQELRAALFARLAT